MACLYSEADDRATNVLADQRLIGTARANISSLEFIEGRQIDDRIVKNLINVFQQERCRRYDPENYIPVLLTQANLRRVLRSSKLTKADLKRPAHDGSLCLLKTAKNQMLRCLHGRHRIKAAEQFLPYDDRWWTIRIYLIKSDGTHTAV
jgi:hypothetical protein